MVRSLDGEIIMENTTNATTTVSRPDFGAGKYSGLMDEIWKDAQNLLKISPEKAEKLARNVASDLGAWMQSGNAKITLGSVNKSGQFRSVKEASSVKNVPATKALMIMKAISFADEAFKNGVNRNTTGWELIDTLKEYVDEL